MGNESNERARPGHKPGRLRTTTALAAAMWWLLASAGPVVARASDLTSTINAAEATYINTSRVDIVGNSVELKPGVEAAFDNPTPDIVFTVQSPEVGMYVVSTNANVNDVGYALLQDATSKYDSLFLQIEVQGDPNNKPPSERVVMVPWALDRDSYTSKLGRFHFNTTEQEIRLWLPKGVILNSLTGTKYVPPEVPPQAASYEPSIVPPSDRPRLWVNSRTLRDVISNLESPEHQDAWNSVLAKAREPYSFPFADDELIPINLANRSVISDIESRMRYKAFAYLVTGDQSLCMEAIDLAERYIRALDPGNILDITREIGSAIYNGSLVYDWCYDLLSASDKERLIENFIRLAEDMEIGWPPFKQNIVYGHGSEKQINRDLLAMSIAISDEDPVPYQYTSYRILEELVPMRRFEYQSPRHSQGYSYGNSRHMCELYAALMFRRMIDQEVFDPNIKQVYLDFFYRRLTATQIFHGDGDGWMDQGDYSVIPLAALLAAAYDQHPLIKGDLIGKSGFDKVLYLLVDDPELEAVPVDATGLSRLPLTAYATEVTGFMTARTGWHMDNGTNDVVVDMRGGGYHFGNHQHSDAGSFQIFYRGRQVVDLGQYRFYGTPYDSNFNKRSVSHSLMLAVDPEETFSGSSVNDGGSRRPSGTPLSVEQLTTTDDFRNGEVVSAAAGPDPQIPDYSYFSVDLASAYGDKLDGYVRSFLFLNLKNESTPAVLFVLDNMTTREAAFQKYWQINTLNEPTLNDDGTMTLENHLEGEEPGQVLVTMLKPTEDKRAVTLLSGEDSRTVFDDGPFDPPFPDAPESTGTRILISPAEQQRTDVFLASFLMKQPSAEDLSVQLAERDDFFRLTVGQDRILYMNKSRTLWEGGTLAVDVTAQARYVLATGLAPGPWTLKGQSATLTSDVRERENVAFFPDVPAGTYVIEPGVASPESDAGTSHGSQDAGAQDSGTEDNQGHSGCDCALTDGTPEGWLLLLVWLFVVASGLRLRMSPTRWR